MKYVMVLMLMCSVSFADFDGSTQKQIDDAKAELQVIMKKVRLLRRIIRDLEILQAKAPLTQNDIDSSVGVKADEADQIMKDLKMTTGQ